MGDEQRKLTPAGQQIEHALNQGYPGAAFNLYYANMRDNVPMVEGDEPMSVSVWPEWHQMIQARIGEGKLIGEDYVESLSDDEVLKALDEIGFGYDRPVDMSAARRDLIDELAENSEPSLIDHWVRNERGEVVDHEIIPNPRLGDRDADEEA